MRKWIFKALAAAVVAAIEDGSLTMDDLPRALEAIFDILKGNDQ